MKVSKRSEVFVAVFKSAGGAGCATGAVGSISSTAEEKRTEAASRGLLLVLSFDGDREIWLGETAPESVAVAVAVVAVVAAVEAAEVASV